MSLDWQMPFYLAGQLFLFLLGWILVLVIVGVAVILLYGVIKAVIAAIKGPKDRVSVSSQPKLKSVTPSSVPENRNVRRLPEDSEFDPI